MQLYRKFFKRTIDVVASGGALLVLSVPLAAVTVWLHFANKGAGAFFRQERPGKDGKIFRVVKFKSMTDERDAEGNLLPNDKRLTKVGAFIRKTSIDELPQLWNVFVGDMSLIGPRPLLPEYLPYYTEKEAHRHDVRPGITGWAQVNGRNHLDWDHRLALDVEYVEKLTFTFDWKILMQTVRNVIERKDIEVAPSGIPLNLARKK
ncbi:MAG: sugar transferase [Bacteroides sp.]|nr:sugar transferase [Bacteroides sp.]